MPVDHVVLKTPPPDTKQWRFRCDHDGHMTLTLPVGTSYAVAASRALLAGWHVTTIRMMDEGNTTKTVVLCPHHARSRSRCEHTPPHKVWKAQDGDVAICKMTTSHLENAVPFVERIVKGFEEKRRKLQAEMSELAQERLRYALYAYDMAKELDKRQHEYEEAEKAHTALVGYAEDMTYQHPDDYPPTLCIFCTEAGVCQGDC